MSEVKAKEPQNAKFVSGSTMRHVLVLTATSSLGLSAIFIVDLIDLYWLSLLGEVEIAAAIGYASTLLFFGTSIGIGLAIAASALVSRSIGAGDQALASRYAVNAATFSAIVAVVSTLLIWPSLGFLLSALGAEGKTHSYALSYLQISFLSFLPLALSITSTGLLRAVGDASGAMYVTLMGGAVNAILDPLFIFTFGLGIEGAAIATVIARFSSILIAYYSLVYRHRLLNCLPDFQSLIGDLRPILFIATPAILTNIATPVGNAFVTAFVSPFGDAAIAGWTIIGRVTPVAFGVLFALSGAIGPILGQNLGAGRYDRMRQALTDALIVVAVYVLIIWGLLWMVHAQIATAFQAPDEARELIRSFCTWIVPIFSFTGALFVANAAFNNMGRPHYSTLFNWGRSTLGTIPLAYFGGVTFGAVGVIAGSFVGGVIFGLTAVALCYRLIDLYACKDAEPDKEAPRLQRRFPSWPFSSPKG